MAEDGSKDFFISYNKADQGWAEWIVWQLEAEGYSTIIQAWDFRPGGNFVLQMNEATKNAKRTIAVLSPSYIASLFTQSEWAAAFAQDPTGQQGTLLPIRVRTCELTGLLAQIVSIDLVGLHALAAQNLLITGIRRSRAVPSTAPTFPGDASTLSPSFPGNWPLVWNVPYRRNLFFTGRETLLKALHEQLTRTRAAALTQTLAIYGLGGIGKTQTAVEYAYRHQQEYQAVFWVRAAAHDTLISDYVTIANLLHLIEKDEQDQTRIVETLKHWFNRQKDWLLILDNADDLEILPDFLPDGEKGHLLLTTLDPAVEGMAQSIEVEKMDMQEGIDLLLHRAHGLVSEITSLEQTSQEDRAIAALVVKEMGGLPLALDQAGAYIEQTRCGLARYLEMYQRHRADLLKWKRRAPSNYPKTVAATWALAFEQIEQHHSATADLLRLCAFLDPDSIPEDLFTEGASELGDVLQPLVADAFTFNEAIDVLRSFSLIRRLPDTQSFSMHRLVQVVLKDRMDSPTQQRWAERAVRLVNAAFPAVEFETWERCKRFLPQSFVCFDLINLHGIYLAESARLMHRSGLYLYDHARDIEAEQFLQQALTIFEQMQWSMHPETATTLDNLATLYRVQDRYNEAEVLYQKARTIREQVMGPEHPETVITLGNLADLYRDRDDYKEAESLYLRVLFIQEKILSPEHPKIATTLNNLALLYQLQGRYREEEPLLQRALAIFERAEGLEHLEIATTLNNLAQLYQHQGRYAEAEPLYQRALTIFERVRGRDHPETAFTLDCIATLYREQGRYAEAEPLYERALTVFEQARGRDHSETAFTLDCIATLYRKQGRYAEAESLYQRALAIFEQAQGHKYPEIATTLDNLGTLYRDQKRYAEAELFYQRALAIRKQAQGTEHPETAATLHNLALLYHSQNRYEEARSLYEQTLAIYEHVFSANHPQIILLLEAYIALLLQMGQNEEVARIEAKRTGR